MPDIELIDVPNLDWPASCVEITNTPPLSTLSGATYVIGASPTGVWTAHANRVAWMGPDSQWHYQTPFVGRRMFVTSLSAWRQWDGSAWIADVGGALPAGGTTGQWLRKASNADGDASWYTVDLGNRNSKIWFVDNFEQVGTGGYEVGDVYITRDNGAHYLATGAASIPLQWGGVGTIRAAPFGGAVGDVLTRTVGAGDPYGWTAPLPGIPAGGTVGQALTKTSGVDYAVAWSSVGAASAGLVTHNHILSPATLSIETSSAANMTASTAYFVYLGRTAVPLTPSHLYFYVNTVSAGVDAGIGLFSSPSPPNRSGQTLTCIDAATITGVAATSGVKSNATAFATTIPAGTELWYGIRATATLAIHGWVGADHVTGTALRLTSSPAFAVSSTYAATTISPAASTGFCCPLLRADFS